MSQKREPKFKPASKKQSDFLKSKSDITCFGGAKP